jgi:gas vesicle protein GvpO
MPEQTARKRNGSGARTSAKLSARDAAARVREDLPELLGKPVESILGIQREDEGGWIATVAIVELARIPSSTDVLGTYRVRLDASGELIEYQRQRRYARNRADED